MNSSFNPGDKVRWYRDGIPTFGTVIKTTPLRVQIQTIGNDGTPIVHYVSPKNLDLFPTANEQLNPCEETGKEGLPPLDKYSAKRTIIWQTAAGLLSLAIGAGLLFLLARGANQLELYWEDGSKHDFFVGVLYSSIALLVLIGYITKKQFEDALRPDEVLRASIRYGFWGWVWATGFYGLLLILIVLMEGGFIIAVAETAFLFVSFMSLGIGIGLVQYFRLKLEGFDRTRHLELISRDADLPACKAGMLPYRRQVKTIWVIEVLGSIGLLFFVGAFMVYAAGKGEGYGVLLLIGFLLGMTAAYIATQLGDALKDISSMDGDITDKTSYTYRGNTSYHLICNSRKFKTDAQIWGGISEGSRYRLWYSPTYKEVYAFELLEYKPKQINRQQREQAISRIRQNRKKYIREAFLRGLNGPIRKSGKSERLFYTIKVPLQDGSIFYDPTIPVELDRAGQRLLENRVEIDKLVSRLTTGLAGLTDQQQRAEVRATTASWPVLVAQGGEIVSSLLSIVQDNDDISIQVLISQLLGDISRDTTNRLSAHASALLCSNCLVRCTAHNTQVSWKAISSWFWSTYTSDLVSDFTYYGCRACRQSRSFITHPGEVVAVLDNRMKQYDQKDSILKVNWLAHLKMFDFDKVEIVRATDEEVERFAVQVGNDTDPVRRPRYAEIPCRVYSGCKLSENTLRILMSMFEQVEVNSNGEKQLGL